MGVSHPPVAFTGNEHAVIGSRTGDEQGQDGGSERELYLPIQWVPAFLLCRIGTSVFVISLYT